MVEKTKDIQAVRKGLGNIMYRKELFQKAAGVTIACLLTIALNATLSDKDDYVSKSADTAKAVVVSPEDEEKNAEATAVSTYEEEETLEVTTEELPTMQAAAKKTEGNGTQVAKQFQNKAISIANDYVNIRKEPNTDSDIKGKLYQGSAATVLKTKGDWVKITSGSVTGYIRKDYLAIGAEAENVADKYGKLYATVKKGTNTLNVRQEKSTEADILTQLDDGDSHLVKGEAAEWVKIKVGGEVGYVAKEYVTTKLRFGKAVSIQEERAAQGESENTSGSSYNSSVASYALQFVGNPYVWGGTSLTNGADCSGFTMSVYAHFGYGLPHSSAAQAGYGRSVSLSDLQPGDLVFYRHGGSIGHVAIYIGGGRVIHAQCANTGITTSSVYYNAPACARRIIG